MAVVATTAVPFDFPVTSLDVARALTGQPHAPQGAPIKVVTLSEPGFVAEDSETARLVSRSIARQTNVNVADVRLRFGETTGDFAGRQLDVARRKYETDVLRSAAQYENDIRFSPLMFGKFRAAMRLPDGRWRVASRSPEVPRWYLNIAKGIFLALVLMLPLTWWFSRRLAAPISALGESANRIGDGAYEEVLVGGPREVQQAAHAMNQMQARIRSQINERTAMLAAIAHDLRTPLARLSFLLADQPITNRDKVAAEIAEMDAMIGSTMDFVSSETAQPVRVKVDLRALLESIVDDFTDRGSEAVLHAGEPSIISADPILLRRVLTNVIGNAVTHGKKAEVFLRADATAAQIEVADEGPGMSDADIARAFEPFFRAEQSRSRETGGVGLGLAIAKQGVDAHRGLIKIARRMDQCGLVVQITLPQK
ncbi:MAG: HAMP domain-containing sensor histidine kinase [Sphingopyxis sp.]|nr:HAMP domain-containing sensor histidine kinase [Sphingopyxis sp.]